MISENYFCELCFNEMPMSSKRMHIIRCERINGAQKPQAPSTKNLVSKAEVINKVREEINIEK
jgi:hypothetical protein